MKISPFHCCFSFLTSKKRKNKSFFLWKEKNFFIQVFRLFCGVFTTWCTIPLWKHFFCPFFPLPAARTKSSWQAGQPGQKWKKGPKFLWRKKVSARGEKEKKNLYPQGNSNPRFLREREVSWASRRWGQKHSKKMRIEFFINVFVILFYLFFFFLSRTEAEWTFQIEKFYFLKFNFFFWFMEQFMFFLQKKEENFWRILFERTSNLKFFKK